jgi:HSP20 family protein
MLMRFDPFRELDSLSQALATAPSIGRSTLMAMDAYRDGDRLIIKLDLPGVDPNSIELTVEKNVLTVTAEREPAPSDGQEYIVSERRQGKFTRQVFLGDSLDAEHVKASYDQGVLTLTVPVLEQSRPRRVQVLSNSGSQAVETATANQSTSSSSDREQVAAGSS